MLDLGQAAVTRHLDVEEAQRSSEDRAERAKVEHAESFPHPLGRGARSTPLTAERTACRQGLGRGGSLAARHGANLPGPNHRVMFEITADERADEPSQAGQSAGTQPQLSG